MSLFTDIASGAENIFADLEKVIGVATPLLPVVAAVNTIQNPTASNAGVTNAQKAIQMVMPLVHAGNQIAAQNASAQLTGAQKLQNALNAVEAGVNVLAATGAITTPYTALLPLLTPAINAAVAAIDAPADNSSKPAT